MKHRHPAPQSVHIIQRMETVPSEKGQNDYPRWKLVSDCSPLLTYFGVHLNRTRLLSTETHDLEKQNTTGHNDTYLTFAGPNWD